MSKDGTAEPFQILRPNLLSGLGELQQTKLFLTVRSSPNLPSRYRPTHPAHEQEPIILIIIKKTMFCVANHEKVAKQSAVHIKATGNFDFSDKVGRKAEVA